MTAPWYRISARGSGHAEIAIYGDIGESWSDESVTARQLVADLTAVSARHLTVRLNSSGGSVPDGIAIFNALVRHPAHVTVAVDALAVSIASLIAMAGDRIVMAENALMMIHAPWIMSGGNATELRQMADVLDQFAASMASSYARMIPQETALAMLQDGADHWFSAEQAKAAGLVHDITPALPIAASLLAPRFQLPATLVARAASIAAAAADQSNPKGRIMTQAVQSAAPQTTTPPAGTDIPVEPTITADDIRAQFAADEANRRQQIRAIAKPFVTGDGARAELQHLVNASLDNPAETIEGFRAKLLLAVSRNQQPLGAGLIQTIDDEDDKFRAGVTSGLLIRAGLTANDTSNEFRSYSLIEIARAALDRKHFSTKGLDKMGVVAAAFTHGTSDFTNLLADVANKAMLKGWEDAEETFQIWTSKGTLNDFKASKRVDINTFPALGKVEPGAEYKYVTVGDRGETIQLATYGSLFSINRQAIINDDLGAFTRIPNKMGRSAIRTVGNLVYAVLTGNPNMADGVALFHANHANLLTGAAISTASVDLLATAMARQTDATGTTLNINLAYLIVPRTLKGLAQTVATAENEITSAKTATTPNWLRGTFQVVADPRLDATSTSNWFGSANPAINDTIEVAYLDGNDMPTLEQQGGWTVDGVDFKVRIDAGVKALDHRGLAKNPN